MDDFKYILFKKLYKKILQNMRKKYQIININYLKIICV